MSYLAEEAVRLDPRCGPQQGYSLDSVSLALQSAFPAAALRVHGKTIQARHFGTSTPQFSATRNLELKDLANNSVGLISIAGDGSVDIRYPSGQHTYLFKSIQGVLWLSDPTFPHQWFPARIRHETSDGSTLSFPDYAYNFQRAYIAVTYVGLSKSSD